MSKKFSNALNALKLASVRFDELSGTQKAGLLNTLSATPLPTGKLLAVYHNLLLFLCAYPENEPLRVQAEKELKRVTAFLKKAKEHQRAELENTGLPFTNILTRFSPDFLHWLVQHKDLDVVFDSFYNSTLTLNEVLNITLPTLLKAETTAGRSNEDLLSTLHISPEQYVPFLLGQLEQLNDHPLLKDLFIERLNVYVQLVPRTARFSRTYNRVPVQQIYYHDNLLKKFNAEELLNTPIPAFIQPDAEQQGQVLHAVKNAMALMVREIDPATFTQEHTLRVCPLERGIELAIYSMIPQRHLPLEVYWGFTFFKNGLPISYGGVWVFGRKMRIGLNIFETFRGGESGYLLCQLMRVFKQAFGVQYFEVEPYQYGLDNPDGIASGAFWFYYRYGFRPVDKTLHTLADNEYRKIKTRKNYRSSEKTLLRFTESNIALNLGARTPQDVVDITTKVQSVIRKDWPNNYHKAKEKAITSFCNSVQLDATKLNKHETALLEEIALWAMAMNIRQPEKLVLMKQMVFAKTRNDDAYQQLLLQFFAA